MSDAAFQPSQILLDPTVQDLPLTQKILSKFPRTPIQSLDHSKAHKQKGDFGLAKKKLVLARMKADPLKEFKAMSQSSGRRYFSLDLISNCHLECTYCILQSYLENNPAITLYVNMEEILERLKGQLRQTSGGSVIGTGRIADSLALEEISGHHQCLIPFFAHQESALLELKTKSAKVSFLKNLFHEQRTVVSWSLNPSFIIQREEYKTASFEERLDAAKKVSQWGYPIGFHLDPIIVHEGWEKNYSEMIQPIFQKFAPDKIAWMSLGTLRFPMRQARLMKKRFPKNLSIHERLISTDKPLLHYPDELREEILSRMEEQLSLYLPKEKYYRCMDF